MYVGLAVERLGNNGESIGGGPVRSSGVEGRTPQRANEEISGRDLMCVCGPYWFEIPRSHQPDQETHVCPHVSAVWYSFWIHQPW